MTDTPISDFEQAAGAAHRHKTRLPHWPCHRQMAIERRRALKALLSARAEQPAGSPGFVAKTR